MKKSNFIVLTTLAAMCLILFFCKKTDESTKRSFSDFAGTWTGSLAMVKTGKCDGGGVFNITQEWTIDNNGNVNIIDTEFDIKATWTGTIDNDLNINLITTREIDCFGTVSSKQFKLNGKIIKTTNGYTLNSTVDYSMCPPYCLFNLVYSLSK